MYLTLTDKSYPKRLAFLFLEELKDEFESQLQAEHGQGSVGHLEKAAKLPMRRHSLILVRECSWLKHVETVGRAYAFIKFGTRLLLLL